MIEKICESSNVYPFDMVFSKINEIIGALNAMECKPETATNSATDLQALVTKLKKYRAEGATIMWDTVINELERISNHLAQ